MAHCFSYSGSLLVFTLLFIITLQTHSVVISGLRKKKPIPIEANQTACDLFLGSWVRDDSYPLYQSSNCPLVDPEFNCQLYGRPDSDYQKFRWKPANCELPRFNGLYFLMKMRDKTVMFVGDSLGRNQWESLICMLYSAVPNAKTQLTKQDPLSTFRFLDYQVSISFYRAPYLVDIDVVDGKRVLRLDSISQNSNSWKGVNVLSFNSGHWWTHTGHLQGWDYMENGGTVYADMDRLVAFEKGMTTWANWVNLNVDITKTRVFFQSISPTHYKPSEWNDPISKNCYGETVPVSGWSYGGAYPEQMRVVQSIMKTIPVYLLDITILSELRKDGHPSIYSGDLNPGERANPAKSSDCSHWCLPGLPDTWNELFYAALFS